MGELTELGDLFLLCYYSPTNSDILRDPDDRGWVCGSHAIILHRDKVIDPKNGSVTNAREYECNEHHTNRLFRFFPADQVMESIHHSPPRGAEVQMLRVPYYRRCTPCKDNAGNLMRGSGSKSGFEYYLNQVPPCQNDMEVPERASLEMEMKYLGRLFCFHIPVDKVTKWNIDLMQLKTKDWIPARDFHPTQFQVLAKEINLLIDML